MGRRLWMLIGIAAVAGLATAAREWLDAVEVRGRSMAPALLPGDRLLVERLTYDRRRPRHGEIVLAPDPRWPDRELIKRVDVVGDGRIGLRGDAPQTSTDSRTFGELPVADVRWRVAMRYWPPSRAGRVEDAPPGVITTGSAPRAQPLSAMPSRQP